MTSELRLDQLHGRVAEDARSGLLGHLHDPVIEGLHEQR
jgi:hypothetical protein